MAFENVGRIMAIGSPASSVKLLLAAACSSRPQYKALWRSMLKPFVKDGAFWVRYRCFARFYRVSLRLSDLSADWLSVNELAVRDTYQVEADFAPDLVVDGGGNIGLFALYAAALPRQTPGTAEIAVCEPLPRNVEQIKKHLTMNGVAANVLACGLGRSSGTITLYCRGANESSFDGRLPYDSVLEVPIRSLREVFGDSNATRILVKLDIEGMEIEVLDGFVPGEQRAVYVVGELHDVPKNAPLMERIFVENGWTYELFDVDVATASFRACSPAAVPLLRWASKVEKKVQAEA